MRLIRYQTSPVFTPAGSFTALRDEMDRLFNVALPVLGALPRGEREEFPLDLYRSEEGFVVRAELPGFRKEDVAVEVEDGILTITGHQKAGNATQKEGQAATEETRISRSISIPELVQVENIQAQYENGVLTVTLPKQEEAKPRQIKVDVK